MIFLKEELISVIVPIYNVEKYLRQCIDSILSQTYTLFELILVDDGSTDSSSEICDEYALKDTRIKVVHKKNEGLSSARNAGLEIALGEWIVFVDSDDALASVALEILYNSVKDNNVKMAVADACTLESELDCEPIYNKKVLTSEEAMEELIIKRPGRWVTAWGKIYHKSIFEGVRYPLNRIYEDTYVTHILIDRSKKVIQLDFKLYYYRQREGSIMNQFGLNKIDDIYTAYIDRIKYLRLHGYGSLYQRQRDWFEWTIHNAFINRDRNDIKEVCKLYRKYYWDNFWSFSWKYKIVGFINCLRNRC